MIARRPGLFRANRIAASIFGCILPAPKCPSSTYRAASDRLKWSKSCWSGWLYLEIVVKELVKGGLLAAMRGKGGGYRLNRSPEEYSVKSILELMEGPLAPVACLEPGQDACPRSNGCRTLSLWQGLDQVISDDLAQFTLADLCAKTEISS